MTVEPTRQMNHVWGGAPQTIKNIGCECLRKKKHPLPFPKLATDSREESAYATRHPYATARGLHRQPIPTLQALDPGDRAEPGDRKHDDPPGPSGQPSRR